MDYIDWLVIGLTLVFIVGFLWSRRCKHEFVFLKTIEEQNLRAGYPHLSRIYVCTKCPKREVREDVDLGEN